MPNRKQKFNTPIKNQPATRTRASAPSPALGPLGAKVVARLQNLLSQLPPGACLPAETALAQEWNVSRKTVRAGMKHLVDAGALVRIPGKGTFPNQDAHTPWWNQTKVGVLGVLFCSNLSVAGDHADFYARLFEGLFNETVRHGCDLRLARGLTAAETARAGLRLAHDPSVDGLIMVALTDQQVLAEIASVARAPLVLVDHFSDQAAIDCIRVDSRSGSEQAVEHLHRLGHRRIAFLDSHLDVNPTRREGFVQALARWNLSPVAEEHLRAPDTVEGGQEIARSILACPPANRPTALMTFSEQQALGVAQTLTRFGLKLPQQFSLVATGGLGPMVTAGLPELTAIRFDSARLGELAVQRLLKRIAEPALPVETQWIPPTLHLGQSSGPVAT